MKLFGSVLGVIAILFITMVAVATLAPNSRLVPPGLGLLMPSPTPTATARPTATATPSPSATPTATLRPTATATPIPTATPTRPVVSRSIFVDQDAQVVHIYENGVEIKTMPCSTGLPVPGKLTPEWSGRVGKYVGTFFAFGTYCDDAWYLFDYFGGILIHSAPYTWVDGKKVYQDLEFLGRKPASHGCIRLRPEDAAWLKAWNPQGVPIAISPLTRKD